jgi:class 3 adenylate cyclase
MPPVPFEQLLHELVVGDSAAIASLVAESATSDDPPILVAAAQFAPDAHALLARAGRAAKTTRDRQLVAIATAHLRGQRELVDALARDHLVDHPDNVLVAWIAGASHRTDRS